MSETEAVLVSRPTDAGAPAGTALPVPRCPIAVRAATEKDLPFIDELQKMHTHMVGFLKHAALAQKVAGGHVLIAEGEQKTQLGYCIAHDEYLSREDVGIIIQLNVVPLQQRHLIGATLVKATFERAAYGCRLFSCWCAQDIHASLFWEATGFLPLAFRTGSRSKQRTQIFWQRRVRQDDQTTPYWFPAKTKSGVIGEDRIVLPIPPGTHWRDVMPVMLPGMQQVVPPQLPATRPPGAKKPFVQKVAVISSSSKHLKQTPPGKAAVVTASGIKYLDRGDYVPDPAPVKPKRSRRPAPKHDPKTLAAARELRDRYLEQINSKELVPQGKYDVSRSPAAGPVGGSGAEMAPALPAPVAA